MSDTLAVRRASTAPEPAGPTPSPEEGAFIILCLGLSRDRESERLAALKQALTTSPLVLRHMESSGAFDLVLEVAAVDVASYYRWLIATTRPYADLIRREETSFSDKPLCETVEDAVVWVPEGSGRVGLRRNAIERIEAERDYVRIFAEGRSWQVLATLQSWEDQLAGQGFFRVHRSALVRVGAIARMVRKDARWMVELRSGGRVRVARERVAALKSLLRDASTG